MLSAHCSIAQSTRSFTKYISRFQYYACTGIHTRIHIRFKALPWIVVGTDVQKLLTYECAGITKESNDAKSGKDTTERITEEESPNASVTSAGINPSWRTAVSRLPKRQNYFVSLLHQPTSILSLLNSTVTLYSLTIYITKVIHTKQYILASLYAWLYWSVAKWKLRAALEVFQSMDEI